MLNLLDKTIGLVQTFGFVTPAEWQLTEGDYHPVPEILVWDSPFTTLFAADLLALLNPAYETVRLRVRGEDKVMLFLKETCRQFDIVSFSISADKLAGAERQKDETYSLDAFVAPFLKRTECGECAPLYCIARRLLADFYSIFPDAEGGWQMKRTTPLKVKERIYEIVKKKNEPCSVDYVYEQLTLAGVRIELKRLPERMRSTNLLISISLGIYALKEWVAEGSLKTGTITQLAEEYLSQWNEPRHMRDIVHFIRQYRSTTSRSVHDTLTHHHKKQFVNFGSGFFGLPHNDYPASLQLFVEISQKWQHWLVLLNNKENGMMSRTTFVDYFCKQYGVQAVQVEFLIDEDIAKGKLKETEDGRICLTAADPV